jgi:hypothetical protein
MNKITYPDMSQKDMNKANGSPKTSFLKKNLANGIPSLHNKFFKRTNQRPARCS